MQQRYRCVGLLVVALWGSVLSAAQAQPDPNQVPVGANPAPLEPPVPVFINPGGALPGWIKPGGPMPMRNGMIMMQAMPQFQAQMLRQGMQVAGFTDKALQDAVVEFMQAQEKARGPLRDKARQVDEAMRNPATTDAQMLTLTNALRIAIEDEKTRSEAALKALDAKTGYTKKPRLEAFLLMRGLLDDTPAYVGNLGPAAPNGAEWGFNALGALLAPDLELKTPGGWQVAPGAVPNGQVVPRYYFAVPGNAAPVWRGPAIPYNGLRTYALPPGVATPRPVQPPGNDFAVQPPVVPQGDVIAPPAAAPNGFVVTPPQQPVPLSQRH